MRTKFVTMLLVLWSSIASTHPFKHPHETEIVFTFLRWNGLEDHDFRSGKVVITAENRDKLEVGDGLVCVMKEPEFLMASLVSSQGEGFEVAVAAMEAFGSPYSQSSAGLYPRLEDILLIVKFSLDPTGPSFKVTVDSLEARSGVSELPLFSEEPDWDQERIFGCYFGIF